MDTLTRLLLLTTLGCVEIVPVEPLGPAPPAGTSARRREMQYASGAGTPLVFAAVPLHAPMPVVRVLSPAPLRPRRHPALPAAPHDADYEEEPRPTRPTKQRVRPVYHHQDSDYEESYNAPRQTAPPSPPAPLITHRPSRLRPQITQYEEEYESYAPQPSYAASSYVQPQPTYSYSTSYATAPAYHAAAYSPQGAVYASVAQPQYEAVYDAEPAPAPASAVLYARPSPSGGYTYRKIAPRTTTPIPTKPAKESPYIIKIHKYRITKS